MGGAGAALGGIDPGPGAGGTAGAPTCAEDEYEADDGCQPVTECAEDEFEKTPPGPKQDRVCSKAAECEATEYEASPPSASSDRVCSPLTVCPAGTFVSTKPGAQMDRVCHACDAGKFSSELNAAACTTWSTCGAGESESVPPSVTSDRVCSKCGTGKYEKAGQCVALTACTANQYESTPATATSDRVCKAVQSCAPGSRQTAAPTSTTDRQCAACSAGTFSTQTNASTCKSWTPCGSNQKQTAAGTATSDIVCVDKPVCSTAADRTCSVDCPCASGEGVCTASNQCVSGASCVADSGKKVGRAGNTCLANHCNNDTKDSGETSTDCGGECGCRATFETFTVKGLPADRNAFYASTMSRDGKRLAGSLMWGRDSFPGAMAMDGTVTALENYGKGGYAMAASTDGNVLLGVLGCANPPSCSDATVTTYTWTGSGAPKATGTLGTPRALSSSGGIIAYNFDDGAGNYYAGYYAIGKNTTVMNGVDIIVGMTPDGKYAVGNSLANNGSPAVWAADTGNITTITSTAGWHYIQALAINGVGSPTVIGNAYLEGGTDLRVGFRWKAGVITELGTLGNMNPRAVSSDGTTIVGDAGPSNEVFFWTDAGKRRTMVEELRARGLEPALDFLLVANSFLAISDDGKTVVGSGSENNFWRIVLQ